jgi:hypothetical protein
MFVEMLRAMRTMSIHHYRTSVTLLSAGLLAASSFAFGQYPSPVQNNTSNTNQQQATTNGTGGWKRVGDTPQAADINGNGAAVYAAPQAPMNDYNAADQQNAPPPPPQQPNGPGYYGPQQAGPPQYQQPAANGQYGPQGPYNGYPPYQQQGTYGPQQGQQANYPPPPPVPANLSIPQGTYVTVRVNQFLSSDKNQPGDAFSATLVDPVVVNGIVVAEPGETVGGRVSLVEKHGTGHAAKLGVQLTTLTLVDGQQLNIVTQLTSRRGGTTPGGLEAGTIATTTGLGAAIGAAANWGTGAAIGAGAGALAGIIGVVVTHNHPSVIAPEQVLTFQIQQPVTFSTSASQAAFRYVQPGEYSQGGAYGNGPGPYVASGPAPAPYPYYGAYPYYGWSYPYYWGPSFAFVYGPRWYGGRYYYRGYVGGFHGGVVVRGGRR